VSELWLLLALCGLGTYAFRGLGVLLSGAIDVEGPLFRWVSCVAYAMIAGLISRVLLLPSGALAATEAWERAAASAAALAAYFLLTRRNLFAGVLAGAAALWALRVF